MSTDPLLGDSSIETSEKICYEPSREPLNANSQDYLIYFITGNPGLIYYYQPFLSKLHFLLVTTSRTESARFHICGHSLKGFEIDQDGPYGGPPKSPFSLAEQIDFQEELLYKHIKSHRERTGNNPKVILMGHSVGAYILLELIKQHRKKIDDGEEDFDLIGGVLLFPTITHLAQSPWGKLFGGILDIPYLLVITGFLGRTLSNLLPVGLLYRMVKMVTKFPDHSANTTASFIRSPLGIQQALHLARDEMHTITEDKWDQEVWGAARAEGTNNRDTANWNLTLYWGQNDKWVANHTRDALIAARGHKPPVRNSPQAQNWKPAMMFAEKGIPHDFCTTIGNSNTVASQVKLWVDGIIEAHKNEIL